MARTQVGNLVGIDIATDVDVYRRRGDEVVEKGEKVGAVEVG